MRASLACNFSRAALRLRWSPLAVADIFGEKTRRPWRSSLDPLLVGTPTVGVDALVRRTIAKLPAPTEAGSIWAAFWPLSGTGVLLRAEACPRGPVVLPVLLLRDDIRRSAGEGWETSFPLSAGFGGMLTH